MRVPESTSESVRPGDACPPKDDSPAIIPIQPVPAITQSNHARVGWLRTKITTITRRWGKGESGRCMLCPPGRCVAYKDCCTITVEGHVGLAEAKLFSISGFIGSPLGPLGIVPEVGMLKVFQLPRGWIDAPAPPDPDEERIFQFDRPRP